MSWRGPANVGSGATRPRPQGRRFGATSLTLALLAGALLGPPAAAGDLCPGAGRIVRHGDWEEIAAPDFPAGQRALVAQAVQPLDPNRLLVSNGSAVMGSDDGGCTWRALLVLPEVPSAREPYARSVASIVDVATDGRHLYALLVERVGGPRARLLASDDGGLTWRAADAGLPPAGEPEGFEVVLGAPDTAYLALDVGGEVLDTLWATTDAGRTWRLRSDLSAPLFRQGVDGFQPDERDPASVWAWGQGGLFVSRDGGATFSAVEEFAGQPVSRAEVARGLASDPSAVRVVAFRSGRAVLRSDDDGASWFTYPSPGEVTSSAHGASGDLVFASAAGTVKLMNPPTGLWADLRPPVAGITDLEALRSFQPTVLGRTASALYRFTARTEGIGGGIADELRSIPALPGVRLPDPFPPRLSAERRRVVLDQGEKLRVRYELALPERPVPLDLFFLLDTSDSMKRAIDALAYSVADIVRALATSGLDVRFGLGEYRGYPDQAVPREPEPTYVYRRLVQLSYPTDALRAAIAALEAEGGGVFDSHLGALYQAATGAGQDLHPVGTPLGHDVPPGLQAEFRGGGLRLILNVTDEAFGRESAANTGDRVYGLRAPPDIPSFEEVIGALEARSIVQIGLAIATDATDMDPSAEGRTALKDLMRVAAGTGGRAPDGGVDCDGDGVTDLAPGEPLVCALRAFELQRARSIVPAIVNLARAVTPRTSVALRARRGAAVVERIVPPRRERVVLQTARRLSFDVVYSCPASFAGRRVTVELAATSPQRALDTVGTVVVCRTAPEVPSGVFTPLVIAPLVPPPPPAASSAQGQAQAQSQAQAQGAIAAQEQEQPQLAFVSAYQRFQEQLAAAGDAGEEYRFSAPARPGPPPALPAAAAALALAAAAALLRRSRALVLARPRR